MLLVLDNLQGHKTHELVVWFVEHGVMPLYTPVGGSWLNTTESIQGLIKQRALDGHRPESPSQIIQWIEATARGWKRDPTAFRGAEGTLHGVPEQGKACTEWADQELVLHIQSLEDALHRQYL